MARVVAGPATYSVEFAIAMGKRTGAFKDIACSDLRTHRQVPKSNREYRHDMPEKCNHRRLLAQQ